MRRSATGPLKDEPRTVLELDQFKLPHAPSIKIEQSTVSSLDPVATEEQEDTNVGRRKKPAPKRKRSHLTPDPEDLALVKSESVEVKLPEVGGPGAPDGWYSIFHRIKEQRKGIVAAVDMYGAEVLSDKDNLEPAVSRYHTLLALMLSSQTRDEITHKAMLQLKKHGLTVGNILQTPEADLAKLIYPVGFYNTKAKNILKSTQILADKYAGDIPPNLEELMELPGVGPKMAHLIMLIAWGKSTGIGVDTHVHRICNRLGWVKTDLPEKTRVALEKWLPEEYWLSINKLFVGFGQAVCLPVNPRCGECSVNDSCPSAFKASSGGGKKEKKPAPKRAKTF